MATVQTITANLIANIGNFTTNMDRASAKVGMLQASVSRAGRVIGGVFTAAVAGLSVRALASYVRETIESVDATDRFAERLGISTTRLMEFQSAARMVDMETSDFNSALTIMMRNLSSTADEGKELRFILSAIGIDLADINQIPVDELFLRIADAVQRFNSPMDQAEITTRIFGRTGQRMVDMLSQGSAGLEAATTAAHDYGTALDEMDTRKITEASQSWREFGEALKGVGLGITTALAPAIDKLGYVLSKLKGEDYLKALFGTDSLTPLFWANIGTQAYKLLQERPEGAGGAGTPSVGGAAAGRGGGASLDQMTEQHKRFNEAMKETEKLLIKLQTPWEKYQQAAEQAYQLWRGGFISLEMFGRAQAFAATEYYEATKTEPLKLPEPKLAAAYGREIGPGISVSGLAIGTREMLVETQQLNELKAIRQGIDSLNAKESLN